MKKFLGALSLQCLAATLVTQATPVTAEMQTGARGAVACARPDQWTGAARTSTVMPLTRDDGSFVQPMVAEASSAGTWNATFRGRALGRSRGAVRARIARQGGLWVADADDAGISTSAALASFRRLGVWARHEGGGRIVFRSKDGSRTAARALEIAQGRSSGASSTTPSAARIVSIDNALMRLEGRYSRNAVQFVESLSAGMDVYPFGTSFVVRVPARLVPAMWDSIDGEGGRVFLVGSSAAASQSRQISDAVQFCGGSSLLRRFPTPTVAASMTTGAIIEIETQRVAVATGDILLTVQNPPFGRGIEIDVSRFGRR